MKLDRIPQITFLLGVLLIIVSIVIPYDSLEFIFGQGLRPTGFVTLYANPILGIIGIIFSVMRKKWLFLLLNTILIFSFFITLYIGYAFLGP